MSQLVLSQFPEQLKGFGGGYGHIRFRPGRPLPSATVTKIVRAWVAQNGARAGRNRRLRSG
ncbi:MAG: DUF1801 domain-containing protein [Thermoplasmata archaeon]|nr:DUF1801 domain-containing protein [Thermoplasmata archaeon]